MKHAPLLAALLLALAPAASAEAACPEGVSWPTTTWPKTQHYGPATDALGDFAFTLVGTDEERKGVRTDGVLVVHHGRIVYERYARGFGADNPHLAWSVSKSMIDALLGMAVVRGWLTLDDSVCDHYDHVDECSITIADLHAMGSGLDWNEGYENDPYYLSSVIAMLYGVGALDMAAFVGSHGLEHTPGTVFRYSSGDTVLLSAVIAGALPDDLHSSFPRQWLFEPLGMSSAIFEQDRAGTFVGSSYAYATPRDMARFGYLYLHDGCWEGERLLPEGWVERSTGVNPVFVQDALVWDEQTDNVPGRQWWTNHPVPELGYDALWPDVPEDTFQASGHWGQTITVIPSLDLVVVRTADDRETGVLDENRFLRLAIELAQEADR
ncbi:MAG: serine hydrolase [Myxococcales bacterium]|nr:serine hydrolase [Myxococcales bacterium]MCB9716092.1 serine hydrolase [Myxococcales bacterium]